MAIIILDNWVKEEKNKRGLGSKDYITRKLELQTYF